MRRILMGFLVLSVGVGLAGCANNGPGSVLGGECKVFTDPGFAVQGKRLKDKQWVGKTQETGIDVCGWKRPAAEPAARKAPARVS